MAKTVTGKRVTYSAWLDGKRRPFAPPPPTGSGLTIDTRFAGLSIVQTGGTGNPDRNYQFRGTDTVTGQVFDATQPRMWGGPLEFQAIGGGGFTAEQQFTISTPSNIEDLPAPGTCLQIVNNQGFIAPSQVALKILPTFTWQTQGMFAIGFRWRVPAGYPTTTNHQFTLAEVKSQGGNAPFPVVHLLASRESLPSLGGASAWALKLGAVRIDGANTYNTWGTASAPTSTCTPTQTDYSDGKFFSVGLGTAGDGSLVTEGWYSVIFAGRLKDHNGNVAGNGADGWIGVWTASPNADGTPKAWNALTLRQLVLGRNLGFVTGPSADYLFVLNHYNQGPVQGLPIRWDSLRAHTAWFTDAPALPGSVLAIETPPAPAPVWTGTPAPPSFSVGTPATYSIAGFVSGPQPAQYTLTNVGNALPAPLSINNTTKSLDYDGGGSAGTTTGIRLRATSSGGVADSADFVLLVSAPGGQTVLRWLAGVQSVVLAPGAEAESRAVSSINYAGWLASDCTAYTYGPRGYLVINHAIPASLALDLDQSTVYVGDTLIASDLVIT